MFIHFKPSKYKTNHFFCLCGVNLKKAWCADAIALMVNLFTPASLSKERFNLFYLACFSGIGNNANNT